MQKLSIPKIKINLYQYLFMQDLENLRGFSGDYQFLKWLIKSYDGILPYCGQMIVFANSINYSKNMCHSWNRDGVPYRVWLLLHKDLIIAHLMGEIEEPLSLWDLKGEYTQERSVRLGAKQ